MKSGRQLYEDMIAREGPTYKGTGRPRPHWAELGKPAQDAWNKRAKDLADA